MHTYTNKQTDFQSQL